jgi:hypothetical protein
MNNGGIVTVLEDVDFRTALPVVGITKADVIANMAAKEIKERLDDTMVQKSTLL